MVEIGDHGAIIVMVNDEAPTAEVKYSLDDGLTFFTYNLEPLLKGHKMRIQNLVTDASGTTNKFILLGELSNQDKTVAIHLDFSNVWGRMCISNDDASKSDYELWSPNSSDHTSIGCTFGTKTYFLRRKPSQQCFIGESYASLEVLQTPCMCSMFDFECDAYHILEGQVCVPFQNIIIPEPRCINGLKYPSTGYIKKKISQCEGGLSLEPTPASCGGSFIIANLSNVIWIFLACDRICPRTHHLSRWIDLCFVSTWRIRKIW